MLSDLKNIFTNVLSQEQLIGMVAVVALIAGWVIARIGSKSKSSNPDANIELHRQIRALEADLRVAQKSMQDASERLNSEQKELEEARASLFETQSWLKKKEEEVVHVKDDLRNECSKTKKLRRELTNRAETSIRAEAQLKQAETELSIAQVGSEAVVDEVRRLEAERKELTGKLRALEENLLDPDELLGSKS